MTNPTKIYNTYVRANLPKGMTYSRSKVRYITNEVSFASYAEAESYQNYLSKNGYTTDFVMEVAIATNGDSFTIPCSDTGTFNAVIDWGDGSTDTITTFDAAALQHTYATAGTKTIKVSGTFPNIRFSNGGDRSKVLSVLNLGVVGWLDLKNAFYGCNNLSAFIAGATNTASVVEFAGMLRNCLSLDFNQLTTLSTVSSTDFKNMFKGCTSVKTIDCTSFQTSRAVDLSSMFQNCSSLTDVINVEWFNIEDLNSVGDLDDFMTDVTLPTARYDQLLINWDAQTVRDGLSPNFGASTYTGGGAAAAARASLIAGDNWTITDGGVA